jgi:hypothetical protein
VRRADKLACFCVTSCEVLSVTGRVIARWINELACGCLRMFAFGLTTSALCLQRRRHSASCTCLILYMYEYNADTQVHYTESPSLSKTYACVQFAYLSISTFHASRRQDQPSLPKERILFHSPKKLPLTF